MLPTIDISTRTAAHAFIAQTAAETPATPAASNLRQADGILENLPAATASRNADGTHRSGPQSTAPHQSRAVHTNIDSTPEALDALFNRVARQHPKKNIAVISGGGLSGCSAALKLSRQGYVVIVAEKRESFGRQNVLSLKTDTLLYWASLSPDGALLRNMLERRRITPCTYDIVARPDTATGYAAVLNPAVRFLNWLVPPRPLSPLMPVRERHAELQSVKQDLAGLTEAIPRPPAQALVEALDLAWPANEPVSGVAPADWQLPDARFFSSDTMAFGQLCDLEAGLNDYCLGQPSIHIVRAAIDLQENKGPDGDYRPEFVLGNSGATRRYTPSAPISLICLAEGAQSPNRKKIGGEIKPVATNESWQQGNYVGPPSDIGGFNSIDLRANTLTVTQRIEQRDHSLVNISVFHPTDQAQNAAAIANRMKQAQAPVDTVGSSITITEQNRVYDSGQIDVCLRMARFPMQHNVVQIGDTAFSGSPVGGYGGSAAASQFAQLVSDTVNHPLFGSSRASDRKQLEDFYRRRVADIREVRNGRPSELLRQLDIYSPETFAANIRQAAVARFDGLSKIDIPAENLEDRR